MFPLQTLESQNSPKFTNSDEHLLTEDQEAESSTETSSSVDESALDLIDTQVTTLPVHTKESTQTLRSPQGVRPLSLAISKDGQLAVGYRNGVIDIWQEGLLVHTFSLKNAGKVVELAFLSNENLIIRGKNSVHVFCVNEKRCIANFFSSEGRIAILSEFRFGVIKTSGIARIKVFEKQKSKFVEVELSQALMGTDIFDINVLPNGDLVLLHCNGEIRHYSYEDGTKKGLDFRGFDRKGRIVNTENKDLLPSPSTDKNFLKDYFKDADIFNMGRRIPCALTLTTSPSGMALGYDNGICFSTKDDHCFVETDAVSKLVPLPTEGILDNMLAALSTNNKIYILQDNRVIHVIESEDSNGDCNSISAHPKLGLVWACNNGTIFINPNYRKPEWKPNVAVHPLHHQSFRSAVVAFLSLGLKSADGNSRHPKSPAKNLPLELVCIVLALASQFEWSAFSSNQELSQAQEQEQEPSKNPFFTSSGLQTLYLSHTSTEVANTGQDSRSFKSDQPKKSKLPQFSQENSISGFQAQAEDVPLVQDTNSLHSDQLNRSNNQNSTFLKNLTLPPFSAVYINDFDEQLTKFRTHQDFYFSLISLRNKLQWDLTYHSGSKTYARARVLACLTTEMMKKLSLEIEKEHPDQNHCEEIIDSYKKACARNFSMVSYEKFIAAIVIAAFTLIGALIGSTAGPVGSGVGAGVGFMMGALVAYSIFRRDIRTQNAQLEVEFISREALASLRN